MDVLLVGYEDQDNLGLRYLLSTLHSKGYRAEMITFKDGTLPILDRALRDSPHVIGFSLIFQYMTPDYADIIQLLRENGVAAHITVGGHYPSFDYQEVLAKIPGLDSIVRFEGEQTLVELVQAVLDGTNTRHIKGLAYREGDNIKANPLRPAIEDLDQLPLPYRSDIDYESARLPMASVLASRGCPWDCSFCSIRPFYEAQGGKLRRLRSPQAIVSEMAELHHERGVSIYLFQDDDFMGGGRSARKWALEIADRLIEADLADKIAFKISCRSDEVREDVFIDLVKSGLAHVYMGVESGDTEGLIHLNKHMTPDRHLKAGRILRSLGLSFDFGFMLLEPYSTFDIVRSNIDFLEEFVSDGWAIANFCRMLPYAGTPVKTMMEQQGRLQGTRFRPDYKFLDPKLDIFYSWMVETFYQRNFTSGGLALLLQSLLFESRLELPNYQSFSSAERSHVQFLTALCNRWATHTLRSGLDYIESTSLERLRREPVVLQELTVQELAEEKNILSEVGRFYSNIVHKHQNTRDRPIEHHPLEAFDKSWTFEQA